MYKMTVQEVKVRLSNGLRLLVDFTDAKHAFDTFNTWNNYYRSTGVIAEISITNCINLENFSEYNDQSFTIFGQMFRELDCDKKFGIANLMGQVI